MIRAVLDANAFASGVLGLGRAESTPGAVLRAWRRHAFELITSDPLIAEVERTLADPSFAARISFRISALMLGALERRATSTARTVAVTGVATHRKTAIRQCHRARGARTGGNVGRR